MENRWIKTNRTKAKRCGLETTQSLQPTGVNRHCRSVCCTWCTVETTQTLRLCPGAKEKRRKWQTSRRRQTQRNPNVMVWKQQQASNSNGVNWRVLWRKNRNESSTETLEDFFPLSTQPTCNQFCLNLREYFKAHFWSCRSQTTSLAEIARNKPFLVSCQGTCVLTPSYRVICCQNNPILCPPKPQFVARNVRFVSQRVSHVFGFQIN